MTHYGEIFTILFRRIHRVTDPRLVYKLRKLWQPKTAKVVRYLPDKKKTKIRLVLPLLLLRGSRPKSARTSCRQCTHSAPDFIQIGSLLAEL